MGARRRAHRVRQADRAARARSRLSVVTGEPAQAQDSVLERDDASRKGDETYREQKLDAGFAERGEISCRNRRGWIASTLDVSIVGLRLGEHIHRIEDSVAQQIDAENAQGGGFDL